MRGLQLAEPLQAPRQVDERDGVADDRAVGMADDALQLEVEGGEGGAGDRRHLGHHHPQRLAHVDRRVDVEAAVRGERGDQLEMFGDRIQPAPDQARPAHRRRARRGRPAAARRCRWRRPARRCRRCPRSARARRRPAPAPRSAAGARAAAAGRRRNGASGMVLKPDIIWRTPTRCERSLVAARRRHSVVAAAMTQAAARIAALLTLPSTWLSNCWKLASKRWATSRAALS